MTKIAKKCEVNGSYQNILSVLNGPLFYTLKALFSDIISKTFIPAIF